MRLESTASNIGSAPTEKSRRNFLFVTVVVVALLGTLIPLWTQNMPFVLLLASHAVIAALVAISLDTLTGNVGLLSFGHAAWYGFGSYVAGLSAINITPEMLVVLPLTVLVAALFALVVGSVLIRQIGAAFAILTLAFSQVLFALVFIMSSLTGGEDGLQGIPIPTLLGIDILRYDIWYWLLYGVLIFVLCLSFYVRKSPLGKSWMAIRGNPERAKYIGINVYKLKLISYVASASLAALAGGLLVLFNGATSPETLGWFESGQILMYVVLGGVGTIVGPAIGGVVVTFAQHYISAYTDAWLIYFGGLFVLIVIVAPGGIAGLLRLIWDGLFSRLGRDKP